MNDAWIYIAAFAFMLATYMVILLVRIADTDDTDGDSQGRADNEGMPSDPERYRNAARKSRNDNP